MKYIKWWSDTEFVWYIINFSSCEFTLSGLCSLFGSYAMDSLLNDIQN